MNNSIVELKNKFDKIHNKGWIESKRNGYTGIGYTFEEEIGKNEDCLPLYDYKDIEIKVHNKKSTYPIHLFIGYISSPSGAALKRCIGYVLFLLCTFISISL